MADSRVCLQLKISFFSRLIYIVTELRLIRKENTNSQTHTHASYLEHKDFQFGKKIHTQIGEICIFFYFSHDFQINFRLTDRKPNCFASLFSLEFKINVFFIVVKLCFPFSIPYVRTCDRLATPSIGHASQANCQYFFDVR